MLVLPVNEQFKTIKDFQFDSTKGFFKLQLDGKPDSLLFL